MIDPNALRTQLETLVTHWKNRGIEVDVQQLQELEEVRKTLQIQTQELQNQRNTLSKAIGQMKAKKEDPSDLMAQVEKVTQSLSAIEADFKKALDAQNNYLAYLPNILDASVPIGKDENDNVEIRRWGTQTTFDFIPRDHVELTAKSNSIDFETASKMSGARFSILKGDIAKLHRALTQFMLDLHTQEHGYQETMVPYLVMPAALYGTGQLPKFAADLFCIEGERPLCLIPTSEISLTNMVKDTILSSEALPLKFVCHSPCFRSEAGSYGKDTRGMFRQHQFDKVELVQIVKPEDSEQALETLTQHAEAVLQRLALPYRVVALCSGDIGFQSAKTYDIEVWLPSQQRYREISSCSNTKDFQARRLHARYRPSQQAKPELVHTLNGSGLAVGRTLIAVLENYQDKQGNVHVPAVLYPYMGKTRIITL